MCLERFFLQTSIGPFSDESVNHRKNRCEEDHPQKSKEISPNQGRWEGKEDRKANWLANDPRIDDIAFNQLQDLEKDDGQEGQEWTLNGDKESTDDTSRKGSDIRNKR